jgi:hypothetical protein
VKLVHDFHSLQVWYREDRAWDISMDRLKRRHAWQRLLILQGLFGYLGSQAGGGRLVGAWGQGLERLATAKVKHHIESILSGGYGITIIP